jgi:nitroreductase
VHHTCPPNARGLPAQQRIPAAMSNIELFEAIHTARSLRRLKPDPVPEALITQVLDAAIRAPTGGNAQNWAFLVVRDAELRRSLGEIYRKSSDIAAKMYAAKGRPGHMTERQYKRMMTTGVHLWNHLGDAPIILIPCLRRLEVPDAPGVDLAAERAYAERIRGASIYPAVQNIILACRALGLGTTITNQPSSLRTRCARIAVPAGRCGQLCPDADRLADRSIWPAVTQAAFRSRARGPVGQRVAGLSCQIARTTGHPGDTVIWLR